MGSLHDEESGIGSQEERESASCESIRATSETVLTSPRPARSSLPIIAAWWRNYHRDEETRVQIDEDGMYKCIRLKSSPPADEVELSTSTDIVTSAAFHIRISRNVLKQRILECMKSTNSANVQVLEDIGNGKITVESAEEIFSTSPIMEKNIIFLWAALYKRLDLLESLFKCGVDIHFFEPTEGFTALHMSAFNDSVECTKFLISCGVDVNFTSEKYSALETACFHNSFRVAKVLLDNGASVNVVRQIENKDHVYNGTPLHSAVKANAIECVQLLIAEGAIIEFPETDEITPLHIAAELGHIRCIEILLADPNADPNVIVENTKNTPLLLAADGGFNECLSLLLTKGAKADVKNYKGQSALHLAARAQSLECVEVLLKKGGCDPNTEDNENRTPLHSAVGKSVGSCEITEFLINCGAQVNKQDVYGYTPLHVAALNEHTQCAEILINNGADVSIRTIGGNTALGIIVRKTPLALPMLYKKLDSAITVHDPEVSSSKEVVMKLDFRIFLQRYQKGEMNFLKTFLDEGQKDILKHPLCNAFLHVKWEKIRKYYIARLVFYTILVLCLTGYVFTIFHSCYFKKNTGSANNYTYLCSNNSSTEIFLQDQTLLIESQRYLLIVFTVCEIIRKSFALIGCSSLRNYFSHLDNIMEWFVLISSILISCWPSGEYDWQNHVAAFSVLFAWINLMLLVGQLPVLGSYVAMYIKVQKEFGKLFVAYVCLLIGFTFSLSVLLPAKKYFDNPFFGFIQVITMMIGSVEYEELFESENFFVTGSAHVIFLMFMLFGTIIMMNLLVGIAVRDIQGLQKTAGLSRLVRQTKLITSIEASLLKTWLPKYILMFVRHTALISPSGYRVVLHVKPLNRQEKRLPRDILKDAYDIGKSKKRGVDIPSVRSRILSFIGSKTNSSTQLLPETSVDIQKLYKEVENGNKALARLTQEVQELKSILRGMKQ